MTAHVQIEFLSPLFPAAKNASNFSCGGTVLLFVVSLSDSIHYDGQLALALALASGERLKESSFSIARCTKNVSCLIRFA